MAKKKNNPLASSDEVTGQKQYDPNKPDLEAPPPPPDTGGKLCKCCKCCTCCCSLQMRKFYAYAVTLIGLLLLFAVNTLWGIPEICDHVIWVPGTWAGECTHHGQRTAATTAGWWGLISYVAGCLLYPIAFVMQAIRSCEVCMDDTKKTADAIAEEPDQKKLIKSETYDDGTKVQAKRGCCTKFLLVLCGLIFIVEMISAFLAWVWFYMIVRFTAEYDKGCGSMNFNVIWMDTNVASMFIFACIALTRYAANMKDAFNPGRLILGTDASEATAAGAEAIDKNEKANAKISKPGSMSRV